MLIKVFWRKEAKGHKIDSKIPLLKSHMPEREEDLKFDNSNNYIIWGP